MKDWFPLTSYDFYAYLTAGMVTVAAYDHAFMGSALATRSDWTIVAGVFWAAIAYLVGQIIAIPAAAIFEHGVARKFLRSPSEIILGLKTMRRRERIIALISGAREYGPLPDANRRCTIGKLAAALDIDADRVRGEAAFQCAFPHARGVADSATRLDNFLNQYGMCRNVSFAALLAAVMLWVGRGTVCDPKTNMLAIAALILSAGLFLRFMKFYAAYSREVFRTFDKCVS
jgi:hypothetical protein